MENQELIISNAPYINTPIFTKPFINKLIDSFDISEVSRRDYKYRIGLFLLFLENDKFDRDTFLRFKRSLGDRVDLSISSKNKFLAVARLFLKELNRRGFIQVDITQNVKSFRQNKKHKRFGLDQYEIEMIADALNKLNPSLKTFRLKVIFSLLCLQGLRQIELRRLRIEDIDLVNNIAYIEGKGCDDKELIYLHPITTFVIRQYLELTNQRSGYLLTSFANRKSNGMLDIMTIQRAIKDIFRKLGINKTLQGFRHYYVSTLLEKMKDVNSVRKFSRHKSLEMLIVYDDQLDIKNKTGEVFSCFKSISLN